MGKRAAIYLRVSGAEQAKDENKIDGQEAACRDYADRNGLSVVEVFTDAGWTAGNNERPAFKRMLDKATGSKRSFDVILVWKIDRFARNADAPGIVERLHGRGVFLVSATEQFGEGDVGDMNRNIMFAVGSLQRKQIGQNAKRGQVTAVKSGRPGGGGRPPYGYALEWRMVPGSASPKRFFVPNNEEAEIVAEMFRRYGEEEASLNSLRKWLNDSGVPTTAERDGRTRPAEGWAHGTVWRMLLNPTYVGDYVYNRRRAFKDADGKYVDTKRGKHEWIVATDAHPAIVSRDLFERVQKRLRSNKQAPPAADHPGNALAGIGRCRNCGSGVILERNGRTFYYYCRAARRSATSARKDTACVGTVRKDAVDAALANAITVMLADRDQIASAVRRYHAAVEKAGESPEIAALTKRVDRISSEIGNLIELAASGTKSPTLRTKIEALEDQHAAAVERLSVLRAEREVKAQPLDAKAIETDARAIRAALRNGEPRKVRDLIGSVVGRAVLDFTKQETFPIRSWERIIESPTAAGAEKKKAAAALDKVRMTVLQRAPRVLVLPRYDLRMIDESAYVKAAALLSTG
jgi:site-specific DNA recombinase